MKLKNIFIEGSTLEEVRNKASSQAEDNGFIIISEIKIISDGKPRTKEAFGENFDSALSKAEDGLHKDLKVIGRNKLQDSETNIINVAADNEKLAGYHVNKQIDKSASIKSITLLKRGKKGFLGIGKTQNQYEVQTFKPAVAEITFIPLAIIEFRIAEYSDDEKENKEKMVFFLFQCMDCGANVFQCQFDKFFAIAGDQKECNRCGATWNILFSAEAGRIRVSLNTPRPIPKRLHNFEVDSVDKGYKVYTNPSEHIIK